MTRLFTEGKIGNLVVSNRLVRSATAERMADSEGYVTARLIDFYRDLARGGVGLIISGHMFVEPEGKCSPRMTAVYDNRFVPGLKNLAEAVHKEGGKAVVQINHGGAGCSAEVVSQALSPSDISQGLYPRPARAMTEEEIRRIIKAFGLSAGRVKEAGFDGVQIHAAHGYLVNQFLSPLANQRKDRWGGSLEKRMSFLKGVAASVRDSVGPEYPVLIKLGIADGRDGGLSLQEGLKVVEALEGMGIDGVEISCGIGGERFTSSPPRIVAGENEGTFLPMAREARKVTSLPILLVGGFRSSKFMEETLEEGAADYISLSRPLICEPDLPLKLKKGIQDKALCISGNNCWEKKPGDGIGCKCKIERD